MYKRLHTGKDGERWGLWVDLRKLNKCPEIFEFDVSIRARGDHPGFYFHSILGPLFFEFEISSSRHEDGSHIWEHEDVD